MLVKFCRLLVSAGNSAVWKHWSNSMRKKNNSNQDATASVLSDVLRNFYTMKKNVVKIKGGYRTDCTILRQGSFLIKDHKPSEEICLICSHLRGKQMFPVPETQAPFSPSCKNNNNKTESVKNHRIINGHEKSVGFVRLTIFWDSCYNSIVAVVVLLSSVWGLENRTKNE